jgi:fluoride exporter
LESNFHSFLPPSSNIVIRSFFLGFYENYSVGLISTVLKPSARYFTGISLPYLSQQAMKGIEFVFLGMGAVLGAFLRYKITAAPLLFGSFVSNVLLVNIVGSFILGIFSVLSASLNLDSRYSFLVAIGFCGSLTTMSSFALESVNMLDDRQFFSVAANIIANVSLSLLAVYGGRILISQIIQGNN